jgi:glutathione synthase/RimK-type ligase-like ATP-grasp enzyme
MKKEEKLFNILLIVRLDLVGVTRLPQVLHAAGCRVTLLAPAGLAINRSRFIDRHITLPATCNAFIGQLKAHLVEHHQEYQWVIIGDESVVHDLARHRGEAWLDGWFPVNRHSRAVDLITSKFDFLQAASEAGLQLPSFKICHSLTEAKRVAESFGFPVILKLSKGLAGSGVRLVRSEEDLAPQFEAMVAGGPVAVQKFARGALGVTEVLFDRGRPVCWASSYTLRCWPTNLSASCVRQVMDHREIEPLITGIGTLTGFHGLGGVDWIHDPDTDSLNLIEFNPRPTPGYHTGHLAGVSFSSGVRAILSGNNLVQRPRQEGQGQKVFMFPQSIYRAIDDRDLRLLMRVCSDLPWNDPMLMAAHLRRVCTHYLPLRMRSWAKGLMGRTVEGAEA